LILSLSKAILEILFSHLNMEDTLTKATLYARAGETAQFLQKSLPDELRLPKVAIVCGSGLGGLANTINPGLRAETPYAEIPNWAASTGKVTE
jgi:purine-nucleoside phosphorylase